MRIPLQSRHVAASLARYAADVVGGAATASRAAAKKIFYREARLRVPALERELAAQTESLRDRHRGQAMFLLGTGPSLAQVDLAPLAGRVTLGVNSFYRHPILAHWRPTYFAMMDGALFINGQLMTPFFDAVKSVLTETTFFLPSMFVEEIRKHDWLPVERTFYVPMDGDFSDGPFSAVDMTMLPATPNAIMFGLAMAIHLGASPIVLLGVDHDWLAAPFVGEANATHFHAGPSYKFPALAAVADLVDYQDTAQYCARLWTAYDNLRAIAEAREITIVNASPGSFLDVFPRVELHELLAGEVR